MCRWRQIQDTYAHCGHMYRVPDEMVLQVVTADGIDVDEPNLAQVYCPDRDCKFSPYHPTDCGPDCTTTCWQYRRFPEQIDRRLDRLCPSCQQAQNTAQAQQQQGQGHQSQYSQYQYPQARKH